MLSDNYLLLLFWLPFISALGLLFVKDKGVGIASIALSGLFFIVCLMGWGTEGLKFSAAWYGPLDLRYSLYLDAYSYLLILLSGFLTLLCSIYSVKSVTKKKRAYHSLFHLLQGTVVACLLCEDLIFFYLFWEAMLIPMYFIIGIWGGQRRLYSTMKFFIYTFAGSLFMLVGLISLYVLYFQATGTWTASFQTLQEFYQNNPLPLSVQNWIFLSFLISFAIKVPLVPFHTWLPDAHVEAPTAGSVILAGVLLKMGTYGLMRFAVPLFPDAAVAFSTPLCVLSVIGIILGALVAWRQTDMKKLVAYSSVSHLGFVTLGIFSLTEMAWNGAYLQMINHGITTGALFFLIGFIYDQKHTRSIEAYGGYAKKLPLFTLIFVIMALSSVAMPGTNSFVGEFLILLGSFQSQAVSPSIVVLAATGVILSAIYMLHLVQKIFYGPYTDDVEVKDLGWREWIIYSPLVLLVFAIGIFPKWLMVPIDATTKSIFAMIP